MNRGEACQHTQNEDRTRTQTPKIHPVQTSREAPGRIENEIVTTMMGMRTFEAIIRIEENLKSLETKIKQNQSGDNGIALVNKSPGDTCPRTEEWRPCCLRHSTCTACSHVMPNQVCIKNQTASIQNQCSQYPTPGECMRMKDTPQHLPAKTQPMHEEPDHLQQLKNGNRWTVFDYNHITPCRLSPRVHYQEYHRPI